MRLAVFGAGGLIGSALAARARAAGDAVLSLTRAECDIADAGAVERALEGFRAEAIVNAAAFTDVDRAEREPGLAFRANAEGPRVLAAAAARSGARLLHVSTDYVFDGEKGSPYDERDEPRPRSVYARSKAEGERAVLASGPRAVVVRTAWLYGPGGKSFVARIPAILRERGEIAAVADQTSSPTRADEFAALLGMLALRAAGGVYHAAGGGAASYFEVALEAARTLGIDSHRVRPVEGRALARPAPRPRLSALRSVRLEAEGFAPLRPWAESYREFVLAGG